MHTVCLRDTVLMSACTVKLMFLNVSLGHAVTDSVIFSYAAYCGKIPFSFLAY